MKKLILYLFIMCFGLIANAQTITGVVTGAEDGSPLPGVGVQLKGTSTATMTDMNGAYTINVTGAESVLVFSFVGYTPQEITVGAQTKIDVQLIVSENVTEEVVVVGYGTKKKSLVTGSISTVSTEDVISSVSRAEEALQGKAPGVSVLANSGAPGSGINVRIRGTGSNQKSEPLYIVDGMKTGDINYLSPDDIESMEVLKDAASSAIYGTEGANGVIIIKTKSGKKDKSEINYTFQYGVQSLRYAPKSMDAFEYATFLSEMTPKPPRSPNPARFAPGEGTNWFDAAAENAPMQKHNISFSGGNEKSSYFVSAGYSKQNGIFGGDNASFERFSTRFNGTHQVKDWLEVGSNVSYTGSRRHTTPEFDGFGGLVGAMYKMDPTTKPTYAPADITPWMRSHINAGNILPVDPSGNYYGVSDSSVVGGETYNPLLMLARSKGLYNDNKIVSSGYIKLSPFKGFSITSRAGMDLAFQNYNAWNPSFWAATDNSGNTPNVTSNDNKWSTWLWENFASYTKSFDKHNFTLMVGMSSQEYKHTFLNTSSGQMVKEDDAFRYPDFVTTRLNDRIGGSVDQTRMASYFGRLSYDFGGKYLFEATMRRDGSSLFGGNNKWGNFPSVSAGWVVSQESFWSVPVISYAKLRASWGRNGSVSNLGIDQYRGLIVTTNINYPNAAGTLLSGAEPNLIPNPDLKWETSEQTDLGLDLRALDGKLSFTFDWYKKVTKDLITPTTPVLSLGDGVPSGNAGDVTNKGFEFSIDIKDKSKDFTYDIGFNIAFLNNEVTKMNENTTRIGGAVLPTLGNISYFEKGQPVWYFRGYNVTGIFSDTTQIKQWKTDHGIKDPSYRPVPGDPMIQVNGDSLVNDQDMVNIGNPNPKLVYGVNINLGYKGFDLNVFAQGVGGVDNYMGFMRADRATYNQLEQFYTGRWTAGSTTATYPRSGYTDVYFYKSSLMVASGAYFKIRQIQLGYTLPQKISTLAKITNARVYVSLNDFFTFTKYKGTDPEVGNNNSNALGVDFGTYPVAKKILFGVSISF